MRKTLTFTAVSAAVLAAALLSGANASAVEMQVLIGGQPARLSAWPHAPYLSVGSLNELREHYETIRPYLPDGPFVMENQWVVPLPGADFRLFPEDPEYIETFSPNGEYAALVKRHPAGPVFPRTSQHLRVMKTTGETLWEMEDGPWEVVATDDGHIVGQVEDIRAPIGVAVYDAAGACLCTRSPLFTERPRWSYAAELRVLSAPAMVLALGMEGVCALSVTGDVLWQYTVPDTDQRPQITWVDRDPLGRGLFAVIRYPRDVSVELLDPGTGQVTATLLSHQPIPFPESLSLMGTHAALRSWPTGLGLLDWRTGELVCHTNELEGQTPIPTDGPATASDSPPRFACALGAGLDLTVFDDNGKCVWWTMMTPEFTRLVISSAGSTLCALNTRGRVRDPDEPAEFLGAVLFHVEVSPSSGLRPRYRSGQ